MRGLQARTDQFAICCSFDSKFIVPSRASALLSKNDTAESLKKPLA